MHRKKPLPLLLILCLPALSSLSVANAQCTSTGTINPGNITSVSFPGSDYSFTNPLNATSSDNSRTSAAALLSLLNGQTEYLQATDFGFSIPPTAVICGIEAGVEKYATGIGNILGIEVAFVSDYAVRLVKNGAVAGSNKALPAHWTSTESYSTYGSNLDLWGVAWTPADINASNFGIAFSASITGVAALIPHVLIDNIRLTVYYYEALLPGSVQHFTVSATNHQTARLQWKITDAGNNNTFAVQRSADGKWWETVNSQPLCQYNNCYSMEDHDPYTGTSFYRLAITAGSGEIMYSPQRSMVIPGKTAIRIYPNPCTSYVVITGHHPAGQVVLRDAFGKQIPIGQSVTGSKTGRLPMDQLRAGTYFLQVGNVTTKIQKL